MADVTRLEDLTDEQKANWQWLTQDGVLAAQE